MSGLSDLLQHLNTEGWSSRRIEREAASHGHQLSNATAAKYIRGDHPDRPGADTLQALADVFSVNVDRLREAAGLPGIGQPFELGADAARLTGPQREAIRTTVRLFVEQNDKLADRAVADGSTTRTSGRRLTLVSEDVPDLRGLPFAADEEKPGDDPGEDDD
ncbi:hypothetical protein [Brachybacterium sp. AOP3-A1-3]|uniref:hypothetical protein n=1 Tax=Brachybacterium sp. AOP3-A1-3 TaxID=3457699 RepID=UPI0040336576